MRHLLVYFFKKYKSLSKIVWHEIKAIVKATKIKKMCVGFTILSVKRRDTNCIE